MKKVIMVILFMSFTPLSFSQNTPRKAEKRAASKTLEGVTISKNTATLKPGYEFVRESENVIAVKNKKKKKKKKDITGTIKCGCFGTGSCSLSTTGSSTTCSGTCGDCTLLVEIPKQIQ